MRSKLAGYFLIPHELLHIAGYRLVGKRCRYHWGDPHVRPLGSLTKYQDLVGLLFPFVICVILFLFLTIVSGIILIIVQQRQGNFGAWMISLDILCVIVGAYSCTAIDDLRRAYHLLYNLSPTSKTPFDWFEDLYTNIQHMDRKVIFTLIILSLGVLFYSLYGLKFP